MERSNDSAIKMLAQVRASARPQELRTKRDFGSESESSEDEDWAPEEPELTDSVWSCIEALFSCQWFQRAWILQETVASADLLVVCGHSLVSWSGLQIAVEIVHREAQASEHETMIRIRAKLEPFMALAAQREWEARQHRWALISLLEQFRHLESTLRRDRFFALLGLASDANDPEFEPDYNSPLEAIVLRYARAFVRQRRGMQLLYRAGLNAHSHRFPSWVPDWTEPRPDCLYESDQRAALFDACRSQEAQIRGSEDTDELHLGGYVVGIIARVSAASNTEAEWKEYLTEVDAMIDEASLAVVSDNREHLKWKVPIAGVEYPKFTTLGAVGLKPSYGALKEFLNMDANTSNRSAGGSSPLAAHTAYLARADAGSLRKQSASYTSVLKDIVAGWRFVVTENGVRRGRGLLDLLGSAMSMGFMHGEGLALDDVTELEFCLH
ncbi:hypothetical protein MFIFM68171_05832 [Madurella fahalii]|uniref:Heterokaryon incompatibility domain-containing protein n=1 Tax=Madurella fahalii TaxID=1157608 RepID=A0ABQ0GCY2_9PEZI